MVYCEDEDRIVFESAFYERIGDDLNGIVDTANGTLLECEFTARFFVVYEIGGTKTSLLSSGSTSPKS